MGKNKKVHKQSPQLFPLSTTWETLPGLFQGLCMYIICLFYFSPLGRNYFIVICLCGNLFALLLSDPPFHLSHICSMVPYLHSETLITARMTKGIRRSQGIHHHAHRMVVILDSSILRTSIVSQRCGCFCEIIVFDKPFIYGFTLWTVLPLSHIVTCNIDPSALWSPDGFAH